MFEQDENDIFEPDRVIALSTSSRDFLCRTYELNAFMNYVFIKFRAHAPHVLLITFACLSYRFERSLIRMLLICCSV